ncbi:hypothetical protein [Muricomes intestini]|uniref:hypothetical protein n=1 Tax=Muricomes intestini TaxID=1796634 RepID=UPI0026BC8CCA
MILFFNRRNKIKRNDKESSLTDILQRNPASFCADPQLRGMDEKQVNMAFERRTEQETTYFPARLRGDPPFTAEKCLQALHEVLSVKAE